MANVNGYVTVYHPNHPRTLGDSGCVYQHILKAEEKLGRFLTEKEVVHHIDGNRSNNSYDNLLIFASNNEHAAFHKGKEYYLDEKGIAHVNIGSICPICGNKKDYYAELCLNCFLIKKGELKNSISREELKKLIRTTSFSEIGRKFGVSDNAIRKWCDSYNLPRQKYKINSYSDEEWERI